MTVEVASTRPKRLQPGTIRRSTTDRSEHLVLHIVGLSVAVCGLGILVGAVVDAIDGGPDVLAMSVIGFIATLVGLTTWRLTVVPTRIARLDVFTTVTTAWVAMALVGALPYLLTGTLTSPVDAMFESVSGFTTTGSTVLRPIEDASAGVLFFRAITQWLGGMGVIVLVVAVLPTVGIGGMDLLEAEAPGPTGERLTPRVAQTARRLWGVYVGFTVVMALAYLIAGMSLYDAVAHSLTTVSTGGFSNHSASMAYFESGLIEWLAIVGMFVAGSSFTLIYKLIRGNTAPFLRSAEFRLYALLVIVATIVVFIVSDGVSRDAAGFRESLFTVLAIVTTTGYGLVDFGAWSQAAQAIILILMPMGAMAGSTAGGVKMIRVLAVASVAHRESLRQLHPRMVRPVRIGDAVLDDQLANKVLGFLVLALAAFGGAGLLIALSGSDLITAFSAAATLFGNVGPGLGEVGPTHDFLNISPFARLVGIGAMLLGRLEIYPILLALVALPLHRPRYLFRQATRRSR
jgi:trk system potassium uptake protein TrkH